MEHTGRVGEEAALVVGEALVDVVETPDGSVTERPGGSALNAAVALGRLGRTTRLATSYGDDPRGEALAAHLTASAVDVAGEPRLLRRTSVARARVDPDGGASYDFDVEWRLGDLPAEAVADVHALYVSSFGPLLEPGASEVVALVERLRSTTTVVYDLNVRPAVTGTGADVLARAERMIALADVVKASDEDLAALWPAPKGKADEASVAERVLDLGPVAVVVTRGASGASWHTRAVTRADLGSSMVGWEGARPAEVVDTIGAGDTFGAGLVDALWERLGPGGRDRLAALRPQQWSAALAHAATCAAVTVSRAGADPPWRHELG